jgi:hypothetical protein
MVRLGILFIWFFKIDFHWMWQEGRVIPDPMIVVEEHYYFTWSGPDHAAEEGHVGVLVQPTFFFFSKKIF